MVKKFKSLCLTAALLTGFAAVAAPENLLKTQFESGNLDAEKSTETPREFDVQGRLLRWRNVMGTKELCPTYEAWRTLAVSQSDTKHTMKLAFKRPVKIGTLFAFAYDNVPQSFNVNGKSCAGAGVFNFDAPVNEINFAAESIGVKVQENWASYKNLSAAPANYQFALLTLAAIADEVENLSPLAKVKVSGTGFGSKAEELVNRPAGLIDGSTYNYWHSDKNDPAPEAVLEFSAPVAAKYLGFYFGNNVFGDLPEKITAYGRENGQWRQIGELTKFVKGPHNAQRFYLLEVPAGNSFDQFRFELKAAKDRVAVTEILVLGAPGANANLQPMSADAETKAVKSWTIPAQGNDYLAGMTIQSSDGKRVRNLAPAFAKDGKFVINWNGLDDRGETVTPGEYRLSGAVAPKFSAEFESSVYMPNPVPWVTPGRTGGWLSDHVPPSAIEVIDDQIWIGAPFAEAGDTIMCLNSDGKKIWGVRWLNLAGAAKIRAFDNKLYIAAGGGWIGKKAVVTELDPKTKEFKSVLSIDLPAGVAPAKDWTQPVISGLAVNDKNIFLSFSGTDRIMVFGKDGKPVKDIALPQAGALRMVNQELWAVSVAKIVTVNPEDGKVSREIIKAGLTAPTDFAVKSDGKMIAVADAGTSQIKLFAPDGKLLKAIGSGKSRTGGKYDPSVIEKPAAVNFDRNGQIWEAEASVLPKRIAVWSTDGKLVREFLGPGRYECGSWLDPEDVNTYYAEGMIFRRVNGQWQLANIYLDTRSATVKKLTDKVMMPERPVRKNGKLFLLSDRHWSAHSIWGGETAWPDLVLKPRFAIGADGGRTYFWNDLDRNGEMSPDEIKYLEQKYSSLPWNCRFGEDLSAYFVLDNRDLMKLEPEWRNSLPVYNPDNAQLIYELPAGSSAAAVAPLEDNNKVLINRNPLSCIDSANGEIVWTYPNPLPSNSHDSPLPNEGDILHTLNVEGVIDAAGFGKVFMLNGNKGVRYLFSTDGIYLGRLFGDQRQTPPLSIETVTPGQDLSGYSLMDEAFCGTFARGADGKVRFAGGKNHHSVMIVEGLDQLQRHAETFSLSAEDAQTATLLAGMRRQKELDQALDPAAVVIKGKLYYRWRLWRDGNELKGEFTVNDPARMANSGDDWRMLFKSGGSVNVELGSHNSAQIRTGDVRLLFGMYQNKAICVAYRYKVDTGAEVREFTSPIGKVTVDKVEILKSAKVEFDRKNDGYILKFSIPASDLPVLASPTVYGDVGVIYSDTDGRINRYNLYRYSPVKGVTADVPSEIRLSPQYFQKLNLNP